MAKRETTMLNTLATLAKGLFAWVLLVALFVAYLVTRWPQEKVRWWD